MFFYPDNYNYSVIVSQKRTDYIIIYLADDNYVQNFYNAYDFPLGTILQMVSLLYTRKGSFSKKRPEQYIHNV